MLPALILPDAIRSSHYRLSIAIAIIILSGCQAESVHSSEQTLINTMPGFDAYSNVGDLRSPLKHDEPLIMGFDDEAELFPESGAVLFRRARLYYSADQGRLAAGSVLVQDRSETWHGPLIRLPPLESGNAYRVSGWVKLVDAEQSTRVNLMVIRVADGEPEKFNLAEVNINPGGWAQLEGEFVSGDLVTNDIVAAYLDVQALTASYLLDDFTVSYADYEGDLDALMAKKVEPASASPFVRNGSAEEGLEPWSHQGGVITRSSLRAHTGDYSVLISERTLGWNAPTMRVSGLQDNQRYRFSIFVYIEEGNAPADVKLTLKRETDGQVSYIPIAGKEGVAGGSWVEVAGTFVSPNASRSQAMTLYLESADPQLSYYVDTLTVEEVDVP